jgi:aryl-alcohol dehydrogenase-like predicted oxidoreductase
VLVAIEIGLGDGLRRARSPITRHLFIILARQFKVLWLDTAQQYGSGQGERIAGNFSQSFQIVTKIGLWKTERAEEVDRWRTKYAPEMLPSLIELSHSRLGSESIDCLLLHCTSRSEDFSGHLEVLQEEKSKGTLRLVGFSADHMLQVPCSAEEFDCMEIPYSLAMQLTPLPKMTVFLNGLAREKVSKSALLELFKLNPSTDFVLLAGSSHPLRIFRSLLFFKNLKSKTGDRRN